jgi:prepilin signal peptidase PulO-like enzyme (type II secretory pathway)
MIISILLTAILTASLALMIKLVAIDLKTRLLPNIYVFPLFMLGLIFHALTAFIYDPPPQLFLGALAGGGLLYGIRAIANRLYQRDTLGLGDVKLMAAAGIWLGIDYIFAALSLGALLGVVHGLIYKVIHKARTGENLPLQKLTIPAGPGFIAGSLIIALIKFCWT